VGWNKIGTGFGEEKLQARGYVDYLVADMAVCVMNRTESRRISRIMAGFIWLGLGTVDRLL
jgi:hypothetical protein